MCIVCGEKWWEIRCYLWSSGKNLNNGPQRYPNCNPWKLNVTLYGKCDFADMMRCTWLVPVDPKCNHKFPFERKAEGGLRVEEKTM